MTTGGIYSNIIDIHQSKIWDTLKTKFNKDIIIDNVTFNISPKIVEFVLMYFPPEVFADWGNKQWYMIADTPHSTDHRSVLYIDTDGQELRCRL
jgi:hypothetical protein